MQPIRAQYARRGARIDGRGGQVQERVATRRSQRRLQERDAHVPRSLRGSATGTGSPRLRGLAYCLYCRAGPAAALGVYIRFACHPCQCLVLAADQAAGEIAADREGFRVAVLDGHCAGPFGLVKCPSARALAWVLKLLVRCRLALAHRTACRGQGLAAGRTQAGGSSRRSGA